MRVFLYGISSLSHWLFAPSPPRAADAVGVRAFRECEPTDEAVDYLSDAFPFIKQPYHVMMPTRSRRPLPRTVPHVLRLTAQGKIFHRVGSGVYTTSPEFCFVQLARSLPLHDLVKAGNALCSTFYLTPTGSRQLNARPALTTPEKIRRFIEKNPGLHGVKKARKALGLMVARAASPPEAFLATVLSAPSRYGGFGLPKPLLNQRIHLSQQAKTIVGSSTLKPDLLFPEKRLAIEYDSDSEDLAPQQVTRDSLRRMALERDGYRVITVTARQLGNPAKMREVARQASTQLGVRLRPQSAHFSEQQRMLFAASWKLDDYFQLPDQLPSQNSVHSGN